MRISYWSSDVCSSDLFFDRFYGTEVVTRMAGGNYVRFDDASCAMNPLQMELNPRNRDFLATWLKLITDLTDECSAEQFGMALDMLEHIERKSTRLNSSHYCASRMPSAA